MEEHDSQEVRDTRTGAEGAPKPTMKLDPTTKHVLGRELGGYLIESELGRGGMAMVYKANDKALDRPVAIKVLPLHLAQDEEYAQRFEREAKAAARLDHPNVVQIYSAGHSADVLYIAMQFVTGSPLNEVLHARRVGIREALEIVRQTALALEAAHKLGIVHRDIKPSNIMIDAEGKVKVMDFGLAKAGRTGTAITEAGTYLGTPEYSSPEQCETRDVDGRSDIYSLGVVLYEMLSGALPHVAETPLSLFKKITEERPIPVEELNRSVPKSVRGLLNRMLAKSKEKRFQTAGALVAAAERIINTEKLPQSPRAGVAAKELPVISGRIPVGRQRQSRKVAGIAVGMLATAGAALCAMLLIQGNPNAPLDTTTHVTVIPVDPTPTVLNPTPVATNDHVVVFDFKNLNPHDPKAEEYEWLEVGITEMLIANLSQQGGVEVMLRDDLVHEMSAVAHKKVSLGDGAESSTADAGEVRVNLNEETRMIVVKLNARWLLSGFFSVGEKLNIVGHLHRMGDDKDLRPFGPAIKVAGPVGDAFGLVDQLSALVLERIVPSQKTASNSAPSTPVAGGGGWAVARGEENNDRERMRRGGQGYANTAAVGNCRDALLNRMGSQIAQNSPGKDGPERKLVDAALRILAKDRKDLVELAKKKNEQTPAPAGAASDPAHTEGSAPSTGDAAVAVVSTSGAASGGRLGGRKQADVEKNKGGTPDDSIAHADPVADKLKNSEDPIEKQVQAGKETLADAPDKGVKPGQVKVQIVVQEVKDEHEKPEICEAEDAAKGNDQKLVLRAHCLEELRAQLGDKFQKQIAVQFAADEEDGAEAPDDRERLFKIWCVVQRRLEEMNADDARALQANTSKLKEVIFNQGTSLEDALVGIQKLFERVQAETVNGKEAGPKASETTPAK